MAIHAVQLPITIEVPDRSQELAHCLDRIGEGAIAIARIYVKVPAAGQYEIELSIRSEVTHGDRADAPERFRGREGRPHRERPIAVAKKNGRGVRRPSVRGNYVELAIPVEVAGCQPERVVVHRGHHGSAPEVSGAVVQKRNDNLAAFRNPEYVGVPIAIHVCSY